MILTIPKNLLSCIDSDKIPEIMSEQFQSTWKSTCEIDHTMLDEDFVDLLLEVATSNKSIEGSNALIQKIPILQYFRSNDSDNKLCKRLDFLEVGISNMISKTSRKWVYNTIIDDNVTILLPYLVESIVYSKATKDVPAEINHIPTDGCYIETPFPRKLTPSEFEKLQTVTEGYTSIVSDTQRYRMLGNGWTIDIIAYIFSYISISYRTNK